VEATKVAEATRLPTVTAQQKSEPVWRLENNEPLFIDELTRVVRMTMLEMDYRNVEFISVVADLSINRALVRQAPRPTALVVETATWVEALASVDLATHAEEHARMFTNALRMLRKRGWRALNRMTVQAAQAIYREFYRSELTDLPTE
jgi:DNA-dependent RNA polymerase auxiliary subunit epsilon